MRGPYLQRTATDSAVLRWRTDVATDSWAGWGAVAGVYDQTTSSVALVTEHVVELSGLAAQTLYYYAVGTTQGVLAGGDAAHSVRTAPSAGDADPLASLGDRRLRRDEPAAVRRHRRRATPPWCATATLSGRTARRPTSG